jgi:peptidyl-prolyl cis-trans isomerase A (cyclophilin A)
MKMALLFVLSLTLTSAVALADENGAAKDTTTDTTTVEKKTEAKKTDTKKAADKKTTEKTTSLKGKTVIATFETSMGTFKVKLYPDKAPITVKNFVELAKGEKEWTDPKTGKKEHKPLYDGTKFHRVIPGFMIQGGDPLGKGIGGPGYQFDDEIDSSLSFDKPGILAMANAGKPDGVHGTNGSQFFVTVAATTWLNGKHTIFGEVTEGYPIVEAISKKGTPQDSVPKTDIILKHVKIEIK